MFKKLSDALKDKFSRKDDFSRQLEIVKVFDLYRQELKKLFPEEKDVKLVSLKNKILTIKTSSSVAANELRMREGGIINLINQNSQKEIIKRVVYRF